MGWRSMSLLVLVLVACQALAYAPPQRSNQNVSVLNATSATNVDTVPTSSKRLAVVKSVTLANRDGSSAFVELQTYQTGGLVVKQKFVLCAILIIVAVTALVALVGNLIASAMMTEMWAIRDMVMNEVQRKIAQTCNGLEVRRNNEQVMLMLHEIKMNDYVMHYGAGADSDLQKKITSSYEVVVSASNFAIKSYDNVLQSACMNDLPSVTDMQADVLKSKGAAAEAKSSILMDTLKSAASVGGPASAFFAIGQLGALFAQLVATKEMTMEDLIAGLKAALKESMGGVIDVVKGATTAIKGASNAAVELTEGAAKAKKKLTDMLFTDNGIAKVANNIMVAASKENPNIANVEEKDDGEITAAASFLQLMTDADADPFDVSDPLKLKKVPKHLMLAAGDLAKAAGELLTETKLLLKQAVASLKQLIESAVGTEVVQIVFKVMEYSGKAIKAYGTAKKWLQDHIVTPVYSFLKKAFKSIVNALFPGPDADQLYTILALAAANSLEVFFVKLKTDMGCNPLAWGSKIRKALGNLKTTIISAIRAADLKTLRKSLGTKFDSLVEGLKNMLPDFPFPNTAANTAAAAPAEASPAEPQEDSAALRSILDEEKAINAAETAHEPSGLRAEQEKAEAAVNFDVVKAADFKSQEGGKMAKIKKSLEKIFANVIGKDLLALGKQVASNEGLMSKAMMAIVARSAWSYLTSPSFLKMSGKYALAALASPLGPALLAMGEVMYGQYTKNRKIAKQLAGVRRMASGKVVSTPQLDMMFLECETSLSSLEKGSQMGAKSAEFFAAISQVENKVQSRKNTDTEELETQKTQTKENTAAAKARAKKGWEKIKSLKNSKKTSGGSQNEQHIMDSFCSSPKTEKLCASVVSQPQIADLVAEHMSIPPKFSLSKYEGQIQDIKMVAAGNGAADLLGMGYERVAGNMNPSSSSCDTWPLHLWVKRGLPADMRSFVTAKERPPLFELGLGMSGVCGNLTFKMPKEAYFTKYIKDGVDGVDNTKFEMKLQTNTDFKGMRGLRTWRSTKAVELKKSASESYWKVNQQSYWKVNQRPVEPAYFDPSTGLEDTRHMCITEASHCTNDKVHLMFHLSDAKGKCTVKPVQHDFEIQNLVLVTEYPKKMPDWDWRYVVQNPDNDDYWEHRDWRLRLVSGSSHSLTCTLSKPYKGTEYLSKHSKSWTTKDNSVTKECSDNKLPKWCPSEKDADCKDGKFKDLSYELPFPVNFGLKAGRETQQLQENVKLWASHVKHENPHPICDIKITAVAGSKLVAPQEHYERVADVNPAILGKVPKDTHAVFLDVCRCDKPCGMTNDLTTREINDRLYKYQGPLLNIDVVWDAASNGADPDEHRQAPKTHTETLLTHVAVSYMAAMRDKPHEYAQLTVTRGSYFDWMKSPETKYVVGLKWVGLTLVQTHSSKSEISKCIHAGSERTDATSERPEQQQCLWPISKIYFVPNHDISSMSSFDQEQMGSVMNQKEKDTHKMLALNYQPERSWLKTQGFEEIKGGEGLTQSVFVKRIKGSESAQKSENAIKEKIESMRDAQITAVKAQVCGKQDGETREAGACTADDHDGPLLGIAVGFQEVVKTQTIEDNHISKILDDTSKLPDGGRWEQYKLAFGSLSHTVVANLCKRGDHDCFHAVASLTKEENEPFSAVPCDGVTDLPCGGVSDQDVKQILDFAIKCEAFRAAAIMVFVTADVYKNVASLQDAIINKMVDDFAYVGMTPIIIVQDKGLFGVHAPSVLRLQDKRPYVAEGPVGDGTTDPCIDNADAQQCWTDTFLAADGLDGGVLKKGVSMVQLDTMDIPTMAARWHMVDIDRRKQANKWPGEYTRKLLSTEESIAGRKPGLEWGRIKVTDDEKTLLKEGFHFIGRVRGKDLWARRIDLVASIKDGSVLRLPPPAPFRQYLTNVNSHEDSSGKAMTGLKLHFGDGSPIVQFYMDYDTGKATKFYAKGHTCFTTYVSPVPAKDAKDLRMDAPRKDVPSNTPAAAGTAGDASPSKPSSTKSDSSKVKATPAAAAGTNGAERLNLYNKVVDNSNTYLYVNVEANLGASMSSGRRLVSLIRNGDKTPIKGSATSGQAADLMPISTNLRDSSVTNDNTDDTCFPGKLYFEKTCKLEQPYDIDACGMESPTFIDVDPSMRVKNGDLVYIEAAYGASHSKTDIQPNPQYLFRGAKGNTAGSISHKSKGKPGWWFEDVGNLGFYSGYRWSVANNAAMRGVYKVYFKDSEDVRAGIWLEGQSCHMDVNSVDDPAKSKSPFFMSTTSRGSVLLRAFDANDASFVWKPTRQINFEQQFQLVDAYYNSVLSVNAGHSATNFYMASASYKNRNLVTTAPVAGAYIETRQSAVLDGMSGMPSRLIFHKVTDAVEDAPCEYMKLAKASQAKVECPYPYHAYPTAEKKAICERTCGCKYDGSDCAGTTSCSDDTSSENRCMCPSIKKFFEASPEEHKCVSKWIGKAPYCDAQESDCAKLGMKFVKKDGYGGSSNYCYKGWKVLCESHDC